MPLPAINRLPLRFERDRLEREGKTYHTHYFTIVIAKTSVIPDLIGDPSPRFSVLLSKKTARLAIDRNFIKRRTSTLLAELLSQFTPADYLIIPKRSVLEAKPSEIQSDLESFLGKQETTK